MDNAVSAPGQHSAKAGIATPPIPEVENFVYTDIFSQAITGELVGMANYAAMVRLCPDIDGQMDALKHAASELRHAEAFRRTAEELHLRPKVDPDARYWAQVRKAFLRHADKGDRLACAIIQEVMLESLAVSLYESVSEVSNERIAKVFGAIGKDERSHVDHALVEMQAAIAADRDGFEQKLEQLHDEVMVVLAQMLASRDTAGHCGLCRGSCVKGALGEVGLDRASMRGRAIRFYLQMLDAIGVRGEKSLAWVARLPL
jgi:rubrerythrin